MSENQKQFFSRSISPFKALQLILASKMNEFQRWYVFFTFSSKFSTFFGKDLQCFLEKKSETKKLEKIIFEFFLYFIFFHGKQTNWIQNWPKVSQTCVYAIEIILEKK